MSLKDKIEYKWHEIQEEPYKTNYNYHEQQFCSLNEQILEDVKEAVLKREEVTQNRINSIINMDEKDFEIADNMLGIKNWILGILEAEKQDNKEIFGDFK